MQTASAVIFWEYERQKGKDTAKAAKEKAFQEGNDEDKRVGFPIIYSVHKPHGKCGASVFLPAVSLFLFLSE